MTTPGGTGRPDLLDPRTDPAAVIARYDAQERAGTGEAVDGEVWVERVGGVVRTSRADGPGFVTAVGLDESTVDAAIAEQVAWFRAQDGGAGRPFEWKVYGHDRPAGLADRLVAAGFEPEDEEAFVVGSAAGVLAATEGAQPPPGVRLREVTEETLDADLALIAAQHEEVWGRSYDWLAAGLALEKRQDPAALRIHVAQTTGEDGGPAGRVVCAAWLRLGRGSDFAGLWGGSTSADWRGRGLYRSLVRERVLQAVDAGYPLIQVDASPDSRPILERLGLVVLDWTRPYQFTP